ncbi:MAG: response regulator [Candidatus Heimdallarchaeaceae archaeon]
MHYLSHKKILIVDDDDNVREIMAMYLHTANDFEIQTASNGLEAVEIASSFLPDIILMDIKMPKMNGIEATRRILEELKLRTCIIGCTAFAQTKGEEMIRAGAKKVLQKPITKDALIQTLLGCEK